MERAAEADVELWQPTLVLRCDRRRGDPSRVLDGRSARSARRAAHFVDGGYYENSGAATALDVLSAIEQAGGTKPTIIVIRFAPSNVANSPVSVAPELLPPVQTILQARVARADDALEALKRAHPGRVRTLTLDAEPGLPLPLGWLLSKRARESVERDIGMGSNAVTVDALVEEASKCGD